jgi:hypothetical protein
VALDSFESKSISKIIQRVAVDLTLDHLAEECGEPSSFLPAFPAQ